MVCANVDDMKNTADGHTREKTERLKTRRKDACQRNMKSTGLRAGEEIGRATWRRKIITATLDDEVRRKEEGVCVRACVLFCMSNLEAGQLLLHPE